MRRVVAAGILIAVAYIFAGERGLPALLQSRRDAARLAESIAALRAQNAALSSEIRALTSDPATIERVARQKLGLVREGEIVVRIGQP